jgi:hypothetical protein
LGGGDKAGNGCRRVGGVDHESISEVLWPRAAGWPPRSLVAKLTVSWSRSLIGECTSLKSVSSSAVVELLEAAIIDLETAIGDRPMFPCLSVCDLVGSSTKTTPISQLRTPGEHLTVCSSRRYSSANTTSAESGM